MWICEICAGLLCLCIKGFHHGGLDWITNRTSFTTTLCFVFVSWWIFCLAAGLWRLSTYLLCFEYLKYLGRVSAWHKLQHACVCFKNINLLQLTFNVTCCLFYKRNTYNISMHILFNTFFQMKCAKLLNFSLLLFYIPTITNM